MSERDETLRARVDTAAAELRSLHCTDHAAASAMLAVRLTVHTLERVWLPALDREQR